MYFFILTIKAFFLLIFVSNIHIWLRVRHMSFFHCWVHAHWHWSCIIFLFVSERVKYVDFSLNWILVGNLNILSGQIFLLLHWGTIGDNMMALHKNLMISRPKRRLLLRDLSRHRRDRWKHCWFSLDTRHIALIFYWIDDKLIKNIAWSYLKRLFDHRILFFPELMPVSFTAAKVCLSSLLRECNWIDYLPIFWLRMLA